MTVNVVATKDDQVLAASEVNPGDQIDYIVEITNLGDMDALDVLFSDTLDPNTTLVPGSVRVTPLAFDDTYIALGNTPLTVGAASGVLANDIDPDHSTLPLTNAGLMAVSLDTTGTVGSVSLNADGSFMYTPVTGFTGNDTFQYTARDEDNLDSVVTGTVTITINNLVWYVDDTAPGGGDGSFAFPFDMLSAVNNDGVDPDAPGDTIYLFEGSGAYPGGIVLENDQSLIGNGVAFDVNNMTLPAAGRPTISNASGDGIDLASGNTVRGLDIGNASGIAIDGIAVGSFTLDNVAINNTIGAGLRVSGGTVNATFDSVSANNTSAGAGIDLQTNTGTFTFASLSVTTSNGAGLIANNSGTINLGGAGNTINATGGAALNVADTSLGAGGWTFASLDSSNSIGVGINLDTVGGGLGLSVTGATTIASPAAEGIILRDSGVNFTFSGGTTVSGAGAAGVSIIQNTGTTSFGDLDISTNSGTGLFADNGGTLNVASGDVTASSGSGVRLLDTSLGVSLTSVSSTNAGAQGVQLTNASGSFSVSGVTTVDNATQQGVNIVNSTANFSFGAVNVNNRNATGIQIDNADGATVSFGATTIANPNNAGGYGIRIDNSAAAFTFDSVNISSANQTVVEVDGDANSFPDNDGDGDGIFLKNNNAATSSLTINGGSILNSDHDGIDARNSRNIILNNVTIDNTGASTALSNLPSGVKFTNLLGDQNQINNSVIEEMDTADPSSGHGVLLVNGDANATLTVRDTIFSNGGESGNDTNALIQLVSLGSSVVTLNVLGDGAGSTLFTGVIGDGVLASNGDGVGLGVGGGYNLNIVGAVFQNAFNQGGAGLQGTGGIEARSGASDFANITIQDTTLDNIGAGAFAGLILFPESGSSTMRATLHGNTFTNINTELIRNTALASTQLVNLTIDGNTIDDVDFGTLFIRHEDNFVQGNVRITNNNIGLNTPVGAQDQEAFEIRTRDGSGTMNLLIHNNQVTQIAGNMREIFEINAEDTTTMNATVTGNTLTRNGPDTTEEIEFRSENTATMNLSVTGNTITAGTANIIVDEDPGSTLNVLQLAPTAAVNANEIDDANGLATANVAVLDNPNFGSGITPTLPGGSVIVDGSSIVQSTQVNTAFGGDLQVVVQNPDGSPAVGVTVTFTRPGSGPSGSFSAATGFGGSTTIGGNTAQVATNASGVAAVTFTANSTAGVYQVTATAPATLQTANFFLRNTPAPLLAAAEDTNAAPEAPAAGSAAQQAPSSAGEDAANGAAANQQSMPATAAAASGVLSAAQLELIVAAAIQRWTATGLLAEQIAAVENTVFQVVDLPGWYLGAASSGVVQIDIDAAGSGWFVDASPLDDVEFSESISATRLKSDGAALGRMDLLTTVMHEMGHLLGLTDYYGQESRDNLMFGFLVKGERRLPAGNQAAGATAGSIASTAFIGAPIDLGTLPAGKAVEITFSATVNSPFLGAMDLVQNQGIVSGSNFANVPTDDPENPGGAGAENPTITLVQVTETVVQLDGNGNLEILDVVAGGKGDTLQISFDNVTNEIVIIDPNHVLEVLTPNGVQVNDNEVRVPISDVTGAGGDRILVDTLQGDDSVSVDTSLNLAVGLGVGVLEYDGGDPLAAPGDSLTLTGASSDVIHTLNSPSSGAVDLALAGFHVQYTGLEPINDNISAANRVFTFTGAAEMITLSGDGDAGDGQSMIDSSLGESVIFNHPTVSLTINTTLGGGSGADMINIEGLDSTFDANLAINGDGDDTLTFQTADTDIGTGDLDAVVGSALFSNASFTTAAAVVINAVNGAVDSAGVNAIDLTAATAVLLSTTGVGPSNPLLTSLDNLEAVGGAGRVAVDNNKDINIGGVDPGVAGVSTAGALIGIGALGGSVFVDEAIDSGGGLVNLLAVNGAIAVNAPIASGGGAIDLTAEIAANADISVNAAITSSGGPVSFSADNDITFSASGSIDTGAGSTSLVSLFADFDFDLLGAVFMADGSIIDARDGEIEVDASENITLGRLLAAVSIFAHSEVGSILDGGDTGGADLVTSAASLSAAIDIGQPANPLDGQIANFEADAGGGVFLANSGALTIGGADPGTIGVAAGGAVDISAASPLVVSEDVIAAGAVTLTAGDTAGPGDDLTVNTLITVQSTASDVNLRGGDNVVLQDSSTVSAAGKVTVVGDFGDADPGVGATLDLLGTIASGVQAMAMGGPDNDTIQLAPGAGHSVDSIQLDGAAGDDAYFVQLGALNGPVDVVDAAAEGSDELTINGTTSADQFDVGLALTTLAAPLQTVSYTANLEFLNVNGDDGDDEFDVAPSPDIEITINGDDPTMPPGDVLNIDLTAVGPQVVIGLGSSGGFNAPGFAGLNWTSIESFTVNGNPANPGDLLVVGSGANERIILYGSSSGPNDVLVRVGTTIFGPFTVTGTMIVHGEGGADTITVAGLNIPAEIHGGDGNDYISGGGGNDMLFGDAGADRLLGGEGNNFLDGGDGNDYLNARNGDDTLLGGPGDDRLDAGNGNNTADGGDDNDQITAGSGDDLLRGGGGNDVINGNGGNDILLGGGDDDRLVGGVGRDLLIAGLGADFLYGEGDDDILIGGTTSHDNDDAALLAILAEWTSAGSFTTRVANILAGGGLTAGNALTPGGTVAVDDGQFDDLTGGADSDWFFASLGDPDLVRDATGSDRVDN